MNNGIQVKVSDIFSVVYEIGDADKKKMLVEFSKLFNKSAKMMVWFDNSQVAVDMKLEYFSSLYNILEGLHGMLALMLKTGVSEKEILEAMDSPF